MTHTWCSHTCMYIHDHRIDSMRKNGALMRSSERREHVASSPVQVKQQQPSPDSISQCSSQSVGSAESARSLPITIPTHHDPLGYTFSRQASDPGLVNYDTPPEEHSPQVPLTIICYIGPPATVEPLYKDTPEIRTPL